MNTTDSTAGAVAGSPGLRIGTAPDSWGVWNPVDPAQTPPTRFLDEVQRAGYHWIELGPYGYLPTDPAELQDALTARDLELSGGTVFTGLHRGDEAFDDAWRQVRQVVGLSSALGARHVIVIPELWERGPDGSVRGRREFTADEWSAFLKGHDRLGRALLEEFGVTQQFHSHAESPIGTRAEVVRLLEGTDPEYTNLCLDTGHYAYYLGDCVELIRSYPERIGYLHLKQVAPGLLADVLKNDIPFADAVQQGIMTEPPGGTPAFAPILDLMAGIRPDTFAIVEQDLYPVSSFDVPLPIATRTRQHLTTCGAPVRMR
ncbi:TIM barrel protein [Nakamurella sp. YIM 132087]|uniref:TIM barrel protein n=1 Tax=Nakamurella alba TaxID=2665158 RepID=A0A7K1FUL4_9ACTN|nr:sugar phosphate isomerase/epimerase [Nakamurella alba]MTD16893.1 TIM barrel protein [Nakamurella alba]